MVCDEPTSITDAYAVIKVLSRERNVNRFRIVTNMTHEGGHGRQLFEKLLRVTERFLQVSLDHAGSVPYDDRVWRAVQLQTPFVTAFPTSLAAAALKQLAHRADNWDAPRAARGNIEFFVERLLKLPNRRGGRRGMSTASAYVLCRAAAPDELVERYAPLVKKIANHLLGRLPDGVELEDLDPDGTDRPAGCGPPVLADEGRVFRDLREHTRAWSDAGRIPKHRLGATLRVPQAAGADRGDPRRGKPHRRPRLATRDRRGARRAARGVFPDGRRHHQRSACSASRRPIPTSPGDERPGRRADRRIPRRSRVRGISRRP